MKESKRNLIWPIVSLALALLFFATSEPFAFSLQNQQVLPAIDYKIGANDLLDINVFEQPELSLTARVSDDGAITMPLLGRIQVVDLTAYELEKKIASLLEEKWMKSAHVTVFIQEYQRITIMGGVQTPGRYELIGRANLLEIISQAGGLTDLALDTVYIQREVENGEKSRIAISLEDLIQGGDQDLNINVEPRDVIIIPVDEIISVYVYGEVNTPGMVEFRLSKNPTLMQAIAQAGGTTEWANKSNVLITRKDRKTGKEIKITVNIKNIIKGKISDPPLQEGDVVIVP